jgi:urea transport system substrate-binding protein
MGEHIGRRQFLLSSVVAGTSLMLGSKGQRIKSFSQYPQDRIKVGVIEANLNSSVGEISAIAQGVGLALAEINRSGGILGKAVAPFLVEPSRVITGLQADEIKFWFGNPNLLAKTPPSGLFWSPVTVQTEPEWSGHTFYMGATPNQQIEPAVNWLLENQGSDFFLIGGNAELSRLSNAIIREQLHRRSAKVAGEFSLPPSSLTPVAMEAVISEITNALPNGGMILNTLTSRDHDALFQAIKRANLSNQHYRVMSVGLTATDIARIGYSLLGGHYWVENYCHTLNTVDNLTWVNAFDKQYPLETIPPAAAQAAYSMVYLWKQAVETAETTEDMAAIREAAIGQSFNAPEGTITIASNHHISRTPIMGQVRCDGRVDPLTVASQTPVKPIPWHHYAIALTGTNRLNLQQSPKPGLTEKHRLWRSGKQTPRLSS